MQYRWVMWIIRLVAVALVVLIGYVILHQTYLLLSGTAPQTVPATWAVSEPWKTAGYYWVVGFCLALLYLSWYFREELYVGGSAGPGTRPFTYGLIGAGVVGYLLGLIAAAVDQAFPPAMPALTRYISLPLVRLVTTLSGKRLDGVAGELSAIVWFVLLAVIFSLIASTFYRLIERYETTFEGMEEESS